MSRNASDHRVANLDLATKHLATLADMTDVLSGFATIAVVVAVGWALARWQVLPDSAAEILGRLSFFVGSPALLLLVVSRADLRRLFAGTLAVTVIAVALTLALWLVAAQMLRLDAGETIIGGFSSTYVNAAYVGLPIATYVLHDASWIAPVLLLQVAFLQPVGLTLLDVVTARDAGRPPGWLRNLTLPIRNPMTLGVVAGLVVNLTHTQLPPQVIDPLTLLGDLAVPTMLIAFGMSLAAGERPGRGSQTPTVWASVALKMVAQPVLAYLAAVSFGLSASHTRVVVVIAALPTAQNIFVHAIRYRRAVPLARDVIFLTTLAALPVIGVVCWLLPG